MSLLISELINESVSDPANHSLSQSVSSSVSLFTFVFVQVTTGPTVVTGMLPSCLIRVMGFTIRLSALPMG